MVDVELYVAAVQCVDQNSKQAAVKLVPKANMRLRRSADRGVTRPPLKGRIMKGRSMKVKRRRNANRGVDTPTPNWPSNDEP